MLWQFAIVKLFISNFVNCCIKPQKNTHIKSVEDKQPKHYNDQHMQEFIAPAGRPT
jgi:hypothetical protein